MASPELSNFELGLAIYQNSWEKLRLPEKFAELLEGREVMLREAGGGRRLWDVEVVLDGDGHMYLGRGWDQFAGAHHLGLGDVLVFSYDGDAVFTVNVLHDANTGSNVPPVFQNAHRGHEERSKVVLRMPGKSWPVILKHNIVFVAIAVLFCIVATPITAMANLPSNRWEQIPNVNTTEVQDIARWAVAEHDRQANDGLQYKRVMSGMQQIVSGMNWKLRIDALNGDGIDCIYIAEVYDEPWTHTRELQSFSPAQSTNGMCKLVITSWSVPLASDLLFMILCVCLCVLLCL